NSFIHEEFVKVSPRLKAVALLPVQDPQAAAQELRRAVRELGHVGAMLAADGSHVLGDERFTPIYEEAQRLDVMLAVHASGSHLGRARRVGKEWRSRGAGGCGKKREASDAHSWVWT